MSLAATVELCDPSWAHGELVVEASCNKTLVSTGPTTNITDVSRPGNTRTLRVIWNAVDISVPLRLTPDGRGLQGAMLRLSLCESRGKGKAKPLASGSVDIVKHIVETEIARSDREAGPGPAGSQLLVAAGSAGGPASAAATGGDASSAEMLIVPLISEHKKINNAVLYVEITLTNPMSSGRRATGSAAHAGLTCIIVATSKAGTVDEMLIQGFHRQEASGSKSLSKKERKRAAAEASPDVSIVCATPREVERVAQRTGFVAQMRFGLVNVLLYEATS